jgi:hypothetical protein
MAIKRLDSWGYFCRGRIPTTIKKHTISIDSWILAINDKKDIQIAPMMIDFVVGEYPINFSIYIEPPKNYVIIEKEDDGIAKEDPLQYLKLWKNQFVLLMASGRAEKDKEIEISFFIEEMPDA